MHEQEPKDGEVYSSIKLTVLKMADKAWLQVPRQVVPPAAK